ncbi:polysaccharide deacetylase family protein [Sphingomonas piscis]|uniref:Chitooligosaccharide deacetylase n=1 Tax=Sphingomonas piscis TaxID=2714943 RepID=A0A6G7YN72_9SPHN|nr:polysaccharide deacetylase family protein [Sphingomonas piscis]QIK78195.1 polysaccharide deacetylase family protein [Sphingomonas piscis]
MVGRASLTLAAVLLAGCASVAPSASQPLQLAITIDDLPVHGGMPPGVTANQVNAQMVAALKAAKAPTFTFVNAVGVERQPETAQALAAWHAAGFPLGNHTWSHPHLSELTQAQFEAEVTKNEATLQRLGGGGDWRWFRYPFLDEGENAAKRAAGRQVLAKHGYKVAAVTMSFSDWAFTAPYARCAAAGDTAAMARMERLYLASVGENIASARANAHKLYGRDIPYVLLMHVSALSARMMPQVIRAYRDAGFRLVTLQQAQRDPVYRGYTDLTLPAPASESDQARAKGVSLSAAPDHQAELNAMCNGANP